MEKIINFFLSYWPYIITCIFIAMILIGISVANTSIDKYFDIFKECKQKMTSYTGSVEEFGELFSKKYFHNLIKFKIAKKQEIKTDGCYVPNERMVMISDEVAENTSVAVIAIIAHEFGHAKQHFENTDILIKNENLHRIVKFWGVFNVFLLIFCIGFAIFDKFILAGVAIVFILIGFLLALIYKYKKIKIEKDASNNAIKMLEELSIFSKQEIAEFKIFLDFAKKTYVGDFFRALFYWTGLVRKTKIF